MPRGSMLKFFQDKGGPDSEHGSNLHWPGTPDGFPFRGEVAPHLRQEEAEVMPLALDYKSKLFQLWVPEEKKAFDEVMDRIVNGWYMQHKRENIPVEDQILPAVWLEWVQVYGETPTGKNPGAQNGNGVTATVSPGNPQAMQHAPDQMRQVIRGRP